MDHDGTWIETKLYQEISIGESIVSLETHPLCVYVTDTYNRPLATVQSLAQEAIIDYILERTFGLFALCAYTKSNAAATC